MLLKTFGTKLSSTEEKVAVIMERKKYSEIFSVKFFFCTKTQKQRKRKIQYFTLY